jgi:hypothetical protein
MLKFLRGKASERKLRLFAVACCRRIGHLIQDSTCQRAMEVAELHAERLVDDEVLGAACHAAMAVAEVAHSRLTDDLCRPDSMVEFFTAEADWASSLAASHAASASPANAHKAAWMAARAAPDRPSARRAADLAELAAQAALLRDIFNNPFRPVTNNSSWLTPAVVYLAGNIYELRTFERLPVLADALQDAGCADPELLDHCRQGGEHVRGCWVIDLLLGKK